LQKCGRHHSGGESDVSGVPVPVTLLPPPCTFSRLNIKQLSPPRKLEYLRLRNKETEQLRRTEVTAVQSSIVSKNRQLYRWSAYRSQKLPNSWQRLQRAMPAILHIYLVQSYRWPRKVERVTFCSSVFAARTWVATCSARSISHIEVEILELSHDLFLMNTTKQAPSGHTSQAIFAGYDNKKKKWSSGLLHWGSIYIERRAFPICQVQRKEQRSSHDEHWCGLDINWINGNEPQLTQR